MSKNRSPECPEKVKGGTIFKLSDIEKSSTI